MLVLHTFQAILFFYLYLKIAAFRFHIMHQVFENSQFLKSLLLENLIFFTLKSYIFPTI